MPIDSVARLEPCEHGVVNAAGCSQIDVLNADILAQRREFEARGQAFGLAFGRFAVDQRPDALLEQEGIQIGRSPLFLEGLGHSGEAERDQPLLGWMVQHGSLIGLSRLRHLRRSGRSREIGTWMRPQCFLTQIRNIC